jgi:hypothetical protein
MRPKLFVAISPLFLFATLAILAASGARSDAAEMKFEAQLLWGPDDSQPPEGKDYKAIEPALKKKLKELPLKWSNYFEVTRKVATVKVAEVKKEAMSDKCEIEIKNLDNSNVEVSLIGKGKEVMKRKQVLPKGEILVLGGNAPNSTAWLVVLKRIE